MLPGIPVPVAIPAHAHLASDRVFLSYCRQHNLDPELFVLRHSRSRLDGFYFDYQLRSGSKGIRDTRVLYYRVILSSGAPNEVVAVLKDPN